MAGEGRIRMKRSVQALLGTAATAALFWPGEARATTDTWSGASGNWSSNTGWSTGAPPTNTATVVITNTGTSASTLTFDTLAVATSLASVTIDTTNAGSITLAQALNILAMTGSEIVGNSGHGIFTQTGGTNTTAYLLPHPAPTP